MRSGDPFELTNETPVYVISVAARLSGLHPQTLRLYDRLGLVSPDRTPGGGRRYSAHDIELLREVQRISQLEGVNLAGVKRILELQALVADLRTRVEELRAEVEAVRVAAARQVSDVHASYRRDLVPAPESSLVIWRPERRRGI